MTVGGRTHAAGGTQYWGADGNRFLLQRGEGIFVAKHGAHNEFLSSMSAMNTRHGGRSWFNSGVSYGEEGGSIAIGAAAQNSIAARQLASILMQALSAMPAPRVAVDDIVDGIDRKVEVEDKANLLG